MKTGRATGAGLQKRAFLVVLDSVGIGEAPDAGSYGDEGANTLAHVAAAAGGLDLPFLQGMGLGNIPPLLPSGKPIAGVPPASAPRASYGAMQEVSAGKDTITGHWEMAGLHLEDGFRVFPPEPPSFPSGLVDDFAGETGRPVIGNCGASGTRIIQELGDRQLREGAWIVYTSADSVFQIAAHEEAVPLAELYDACSVARRLCNPYRIGRVIARPFTGAPGGPFARTANRRDYAYPPPEPTVLEHLHTSGITVSTVGKLDDIFAGRGIARGLHARGNAEAQETVLRLAAEGAPGLVFANLIDFDMLYGHRRDPLGYAAALREADAFLASLHARMREADLLIVTADHGNDPTFRGSDHTREYVPVLVCGRRLPPRALGIRKGFFDVAQTLATHFGLSPQARGRSMI